MFFCTTITLKKFVKLEKNNEIAEFKRHIQESFNKKFIPNYAALMNFHTLELKKKIN